MLMELMLPSPKRGVLKMFAEAAHPVFSISYVRKMPRIAA
jgi:hypothetical protein